MTDRAFAVVSATLMIMFVLLVAGCVGSRPQGPIDVNHDGDFSEQNVTLNDGRVIHCLFWVSGQYSQSNTSGMSCDWATK